MKLSRKCPEGIPLLNNPLSKLGQRWKCLVDR